MLQDSIARHVPILVLDHFVSNQEDFVKLRVLDRSTYQMIYNEAGRAVKVYPQTNWIMGNFTRFHNNGTTTAIQYISGPTVPGSKFLCTLFWNKNRTAVIAVPEEEIK